MSLVVDGLTFSGSLQPPDVPADPTGDDWRGLQGATGATGATGAQGPPGTLTAATIPTSSDGLAPGTVWNNGGVLCVA